MLTQFVIARLSAIIIAATPYQSTCYSPMPAAPPSPCEYRKRQSPNTLRYLPPPSQPISPATMPRFRKIPPIPKQPLTPLDPTIILITNTLSDTTHTKVFCYFFLKK